MQKSKGFTLIELLVVIAIIGILAAIVFVNVSSSRNKAKDATIIADISSIPSAAETYANGGSYSGMTTATTGVANILAGIYAQNGGTAYTSGTYCSSASVNSPDKGSDATSNILCNVAAGTYCIQSTLNAGGNYCVDSTGYIGTTANCATKTSCQ